jgi:allophanate hydrolase subunit 1
MSKDSRKIVTNWLVMLLGFVPGSAVAQAGVMSISCGLKGNYGGIS